MLSFLGPQGPLDKLAKAAKAEFDPQYGLYGVDCKASGFTWSIWASGKEFAIDAANLIWEVEPNSCVLGYGNKQIHLKPYCKRKQDLTKTVKN